MRADGVITQSKTRPAPMWPERPFNKKEVITEKVIENTPNSPKSWQMLHTGHWSDEVKTLIQVFSHKFGHKHVFQLDNDAKNASKTVTTKPVFLSGDHKALISVP